MMAAWQISVAELRHKSPQAQELLRCCAFLGSEPIPREVFKLGLDARLTRDHLFSLTVAVNLASDPAALGKRPR